MKKFLEKYNQLLNQTKFKKETSAGILLYRFNKNHELEVMLGKCGGPLWSKRNTGAWNIPKGHIQGNESLKEGAVREFQEETSIMLTSNDIMGLTYLGMNNTRTGKNVYIFALEKDCAPNSYKVNIKSNLCNTEWPPKSGNIIQVPELSEASYFDLNTAENLIFSYQKVFLTYLKEKNK